MILLGFMIRKNDDETLYCGIDSGTYGSGYPIFMKAPCHPILYKDSITAQKEADSMKRYDPCQVFPVYLHD